MRNSQYKNLLIGCSVLLGIAITSGCAGKFGTPAQPSEAELCAQLKDVVEQSESEFPRLKTTPTISPFSGMTKWETKPVFPDSQCDVLEWAGGRTNFVCTWPDAAEASARETQVDTSARIGTCLGREWSRTDSRGQTGAAAIFSRPGKKTQVVMRYFRPRQGLGDRWETSLTIGDEVKAENR